MRSCRPPTSSTCTPSSFLMLMVGRNAAARQRPQRETPYFREWQSLLDFLSNTCEVAAAEQTDQMVHEVTSRRRLRRAARPRLEGPVPSAHLRHRGPHRPDARRRAALRGRHGRGDDGRTRAELPRVRHPAVGPVRCAAGHRARDRPGTRADAAGHDHRLRRQPHVHARGVRGRRLRHRHLAGARRARVAVSRARAAEGAAHQRQRRAPAGRVRRRTSFSRSSSASA